jgi:glycosyltransferase involved in cell wall biosynthesis
VGRPKVDRRWRAGPPPTASIVICTRNRASSLRSCLAAITQDDSRAEREVIVVDNGSSDDTEAVIATAVHRAQHLSLRTIWQPIVGLSVARNTGVSAARGEYVLFTDDDVRVEKGWADALVAGFQLGGSVGAVAGRIVPEWEVAPPEWLSAWIGHLVGLRDYGPTAKELGEADPPVGANMAVRRELIRYLPFDTSLGHTGGRAIGYEEVLMARRLRQTSTIWYAPDAVVHHAVTASRMTVRAVRRAAYYNGFGQARYDRANAEATSRILAAAAVPALAGRALFRQAMNGSSGNPSVASIQYEMSVFRELGRHVELSLGGGARLSDWVAQLLVRA